MQACWAVTILRLLLGATRLSLSPETVIMLGLSLCAPMLLVLNCHVRRLLGLAAQPPELALDPVRLASEPPGEQSSGVFLRIYLPRHHQSSQPRQSPGFMT